MIKGKHTDDLRILYYNGLKQVPTYFFYDETKPSNPNVEFYPVTTHMDNPYDMQFDLSFGMPPYTVLPLGFQYSAIRTWLTYTTTKLLQR
jgi:hypothetical protein